MLLGTGVNPIPGQTAKSSGRHADRQIRVKTMEFGGIFRLPGLKTLKKGLFRPFRKAKAKATRPHEDGQIEEKRENLKKLLFNHYRG